MADEVNLAFVTPGTDADLIRQWKAEPPGFLAPDGYELFDESYDTLVFRANVTTTGMKILMWGFAKTLYTISVNFRPDREGTTRVTMVGKALEPTRAAIVQYATDHQAA